jgi:hypothetical protein
METAKASAGSMMGLAIILAIILWLFPLFVIWIAWIAVILMFLGGLAAYITQ